MGASRTRRLRSPSLFEEEDEEVARRRRAPSLPRRGQGGQGEGQVEGGPRLLESPPASPRRRNMKRGYVWHLILCRLAQLSVGP